LTAESIHVPFPFATTREQAVTLTLYTNPRSRGRVARWMLEELGEPYEAVVLDYASGMKAPEYLATNPMGKVPALVHDGAVVTEVAAICAYLADAFPDAGLGPRPEERARYYRWLFFAAGPVEAAVTNRALGVEPTEQQRGFVGYGSFDTAVSTLEAALAAGPYVAGERFTAADVYLGGQVMFGLQFGSLPRNDAFVAYAERLGARRAHARAAAADDALLAPA
jgi:glutathione S-transferase